MLALRELVWRIADRTPGVGTLEESLKWSEPAYRPRGTVGSTVRMDWKPRTPTVCALYFNCQTTLVERFRVMYPDGLRFEGNRAIILPLDEPLPREALAWCIEEALLYRSRKRATR
jgi:hypothetical protein